MNEKRREEKRKKIEKEQEKNNDGEKKRERERERERGRERTHFICIWIYILRYREKWSFWLMWLIIFEQANWHKRPSLAKFCDQTKTTTKIVIYFYQYWWNNDLFKAIFDKYVYNICIFKKLFLDSSQTKNDLIQSKKSFQCDLFNLIVVFALF